MTETEQLQQLELPNCTDPSCNSQHSHTPSLEELVSIVDPVVCKASKSLFNSTHPVLHHRSLLEMLLIRSDYCCFLSLKARKKHSKWDKNSLDINLDMQDSPAPKELWSTLFWALF